MCFSLEWLKNLLIWIVIVCVIVGMIRVLISFVIPKLGIGGEVVAVIVRILTILLWGIVCIALIVFVFDLVACVAGGGLGVTLPRLR